MGLGISKRRRIRGHIDGRVDRAIGRQGKMVDESIEDFMDKKRRSAIIGMGRRRKSIFG